MSRNLRISNRHNVAILPFATDVKQLIPHARVFTWRDTQYLLVPNKPTELKLLRNLGYTPPSPIITRYDWAGTTPYKHQKTTAALLVDNSRAYVLNGMGSGKTRATLYAIDYLMQQGEINRVLIIAPLSTLTTVWEAEVFAAFPHLESVALHGTKTKRLQLLDQCADIYIINHDGVHTILDELITRTDIDCVVIDELATLRNARTRRWKATHKVLSGRKFVWGLSGLPTPNAPTDAWAQVRLLTPDNVPKYFKRFQQETMYQVTQFKWVPRDNANDVVHAAMQPAVRYATEDCIDLPPTTFSTRECSLTSEQSKVYKAVLDNYYVMFKGKEITAVNEGVLLSKLLQVCSGFAYAGEFGILSLDVSHRMQILEEIIEETDQKVIVFVPYTAGVDLVYKELQARKHTVERIYGSTSKKERDRIFNLFSNSSHPRVLVAHPGTMSHGLTLVAANTIVWYSPTNSYETYDQANARIVRPGQKHHTHIINIESSAVERRVFKRLQSKQKVQGTLLELFATRGTQSGLV